MVEEIGSLPTSEMIQSASLLYDTASKYLLVSVSYATNLDKGESAGLFYLINPENPGCYYDLTQDDGAVFTSLYQHEWSGYNGKEGVYLYADETPISLTVGDSKPLPQAEAYYYSKGQDGLVTNRPIDVSWGIDSYYGNIITLNSSDGTITGVAAGSTRIRASAKSNDVGTDGNWITVRVREDTGLAGATVGALVDTGSGNPSWGVIDLGLDDSGNLTFDASEHADKNYTAGGYAQGKLWGYNSSEGKKLYPFNAKTFAASGTPIETSENVVDLTGAPEIKGGIPYSGGTMDSPASLVYVNRSRQIGYLWEDSEGNIKASYVSDDSNRLSAIAYVGYLTAEKVRAQFPNNSDLGNCDDNAVCHVYYALAEDADGNVSTLLQLILVPQVETDGTLSYTLCGSTIATVTGFPSDDDDNASTSSMDLLKTAGKTYLLVARSSMYSGGSSLWKIDITNYAYDKNVSANNTLEAKKIGGLGSPMQKVTALYHTVDMKLDKTQLLQSAGWNDTQTTTLSTSRKAVSAEQSGSGAVTTAETIKVPIYASEAATNGLWTLKYDTEKLSGPVVRAENKEILCWSYRHYYPTTGIVRIAFAIQGKVGLTSSAEKPLFTVTFTVKEGQSASTDDVKITQRELNDKLYSGDNTGGNTGGSTGTVTPSKPETLPFTDVEDGSYCYDAVRWAVEKGVTEGVSESSFAPNEPCTRGQAVTFLWRAAGSPAPESQEMPFTDVAESSPYAKAILWAAENGVTKGVTETTFAPNNTCVRGQIVTFLYRLWS